MNIKKIVLTNFKNFKDKTIELTDNNTITGANGVGKTSVYHAMEFAIFGTIDGSSKIDRFIHNDTESMTVVIFTDKGVISRHRTLTGRTTLKLNEMPVKQDDINLAIGVAYTDFLSATRVGYFMGLDNASKRRILLEITKPVDKREIFDRLVGDKELADELHINFDDLDTTFKSVKAQHTLLETQQNMHLTNRKLLNEQIVEAENDLKEVEKVDVSVLEKKLNEITDKLRDEADRLTEGDQDIVRLQIELEGVRLKELYEVEVTAASAKKIITKLKKELKDLPSPICKECGQSVGDMGKKRSIENDITHFENELTNIEKNKEIEEKNKEVKKRVKEIEDKLESIKEEDDTLLKELTLKWNRLNEEINAINISNAQYETREHTLEGLKVRLHQELESSIENDLFKYERAYNALKPGGILVEELKLKKKELDAKTKGVYTFEFLKKNKGGDGYTEVVEIYRDGLEFTQMSTGQKMKLGINIARVIGKHYKTNFLFIDDASLLDVSVKPLTGGEQLLSVYNEGKELTIK